MIRHVVTFSFDAGASTGARDAILAELDTFPQRFPAMQGWALGPNTSPRDRTYDWIFVVDFATQDDLVAYLSSEAHERFVAEKWRPVVSHRAITSFEILTSSAPS